LFSDHDRFCRLTAMRESAHIHNQHRLGWLGDVQLAVLQDRRVDRRGRKKLELGASGQAVPFTG